MPSATFTSSGTWTVPLTADPSTISIYATGEGGNSGTAVVSTHSGGGGGGGAFAGETNVGGLKVGSVLSFTIGQGGSSTNTSVTGASVTVTAAFGASALSGTGGAGGAAGANSIAFAGGTGGNGINGAAEGGGGGGGSAGSTGAGGTGTNGTAGSGGTGGTAGTGAAGPPSLAGAAGGHGGAPNNSGVTSPGTPGAGAGGPGDNSAHPANQGARGQVVITWSTLNGVGLPTATVGISAFVPIPSLTSLKVTATAGGSAVNGLLLRVRVLDNAALPTALNSGTQTASTTQAADVALTPASTGSLAYSAVVTATGSPLAATGNTAVDSVANHGTFVSTATLTANTPFTAGSSATPATGGCAALEVTPFGGTIATDASSPAVVNATGATTATTAAFTPPPGGLLILALVSALGGSGVVSMAVTDTYGLTWAQAVASDPAGNDYAGIWYAYTPAALSFTAIAPPPALVGTAYSYTLGASGGYGNYGWTLASGSLPTGLSLNGSTGIISGTPSATGLFTFTLTVTDGFGNTATTGTISMVVNQGITGSGSIRQGWTAAALPYTYGTLEIPVGTTDHDWVFVSVSWEDTEDMGIAYCTDDVRNFYQAGPLSSSGNINTQVFVAPNARAASTVYVSTSAYVRWLTAMVLDVTGLQAGYVVDASNSWAGGPAGSFTESLSATQPDFILSVGAFQGAPQTITQSGSGVTWNALSWAGINGSASDGITQSAAWAVPGSSASPSMQYTATSSGNYSGVMVAVKSAGGLPANSNPAWPVIKCEAAFGYTPQEPTVTPTWTDITSRFLGINGSRGRSFELDELSAADLTVHLDNFDGALSPANSSSPYYPNVTLITPIRVTAQWQGRTYVIFRGLIHAIPQTYDFQRPMTAIAVSDEFSKLPQILLPGAMISEMLYDKPVSLWPLNEPQGATSASNWSSRSAAALLPTAGQLISGGGTAASVTQSYITIFGRNIPVSSALAAQFNALTNLKPGTSSTSAASQPAAAPTPTTPTTGFGNGITGTYPLGLMGTQDSVWGNTTSLTASNYYQGTALVDFNDTNLPLTATGATYSVWAQMYYVPSNSSAILLSLTDLFGSAGTKNYLTLSYNGTNVTVTQTAGSTNFTPPAYLFDSKWHLWTVTVSTGGTITVYLDGSALGTMAGSFPSGSPGMLQFGGDTTATTSAGAGIFTGSMYLAGTVDRVVDAERILTWYQSGATGFLDELGGTRIQRVLAWARWSAPQAVDPGVSKQQQFSYLQGGYANNGLTGSIGNYQTAGGSIAVDQGAQVDVTVQDIAATENGLLIMTGDGTLAYRQRGGAAPAALAMGDMDYAFNAWQAFENGLGPWTSTGSCTVAQSAGWSYAGKHSALMTVTGTPSQAYVRGDFFGVTPGQVFGFSCWVMSPQGCTAELSVDFFTDSTFSTFVSTANSPSVSCPPMTPVFVNFTGITTPGTAHVANPGPTIISSPATGTQLYFDRPRLSPTGFQASYEGDVELVEDIQYLYNDIAITRNVDQATYRARDATSRGKYYPRVYLRTIYSSVNDANAVVNCANTLLAAFAQPQLRVTKVTVNAAGNPELWPFVLSTGIGDTVSFTRSPVGVPATTGTFTVLSIQPDIAPDKADFTYVLAPVGVY